MKRYQKVLLSCFLILLALCLILVGVLFYYFPHYKKVKTPMSISKDVSEIRVMSYNIRCFSPDDFGKKSWFYRADLIRQNIEKEQPTIIGFQEVTKAQYPYLCDVLEGYDSVLTYRDKSIAPEGCPIFYRKDLYNLIDKGSFWLSETPEEMSKDWGAACYRICSYVILKEKESGEEFVVFNTHLDHVSDEARIKGIGVVLDKIQAFGDLPAVLMGDFNADEDSETYRSATEHFIDSKYCLENPDTKGTYQNWGKALSEPPIDYVMISKKGFEVKNFKVIDRTFDTVYSSDHFPLLAELELED